jgi:hypothetical protein
MRRSLCLFAGTIVSLVVLQSKIDRYPA